MSPLDSRRESGTADPAATEANQNTHDKATSAPADSNTKVSSRGEDVKRSLKQKQHKKHSSSKSTKSKPSRKSEVPESGSETSSDDDVSSLDDSDEEDSRSESEIEQKKSKRSSKTGTDARGSKKAALQLKRQEKKQRAKKTRLHESGSEDDENSENSENSGEAEDDDDTIDNYSRGDKHDSRDNRKGRQQSTKQELQLNNLQQLQQLTQLMLQNQQLSTPNSPARLVPGGAGQGLIADTGQTQVHSQNPLLQNLFNAQLAQILQGSGGQAGRRGNLLPDGQILGRSGRRSGDAGKKRNATIEKTKAAGDGNIEFKRVDQVWDSSIHNYKLKDTTQSSASSKYEGFIFHVRRTFDWEGKYKTTYVDIKSKFLRDCLRDVIGNIKGVSLVEETPKLDPNMLFLYLDDLRKHLKALKKAKVGGSSKKERRREEKRVDMKRRHLKVLVKYIDQDYAEVKKSLLPMLDNGLITFDMLWALWKPGTLVYTSTYGCHDEPRAFKIDGSEKHFSMMRGDFYWVEGKYFEYDGKQFGYGNTSVEIPDFQGARKITSLPCYPLKFHKNEARVRETLIERGKKFSKLSGVHYKSHQGMAFYKRKKAVVKVNINGRVMVDPSIHRRINPNYQASIVRPKDHETGSEGEDSDDDGSDCGCHSESEGNDGSSKSGDGREGVKYVAKLVKDKSGTIRLMKVLKEDAEGVAGGKLDAVTPKDGESDTKVDTEEASEATEGTEAPPTPEFSDEEYLISSPVVLGFAFSEKLWLEFTVSGFSEIQWNEGAYDSLVLEPKTKDIVKALVESHKYHAAESIDDVIQGKGKGLVAVLHGPPGTGKTLTAEGISELLKCPLYMASAGELGTDSRLLESELQKILDICHAWGAILLLDEADVFLEKRNMHDIHRNALVSIFLRQLEYFQGILFLTTNRVETFDDAFQSRIHIALRYDALDQKAKRTIFKIFVERVRVLEKADPTPLTEEDYADLAKHDLNGRQIKNTVRTAQALAVNKGEALGMRHIRQVLDVLVSFDRDLKGGTGYQEAMRSYF